MKTFKEYIQEGLTDKMTPKSEEEIRRTFEEKHEFWVNSTETYKVNSSGGFGNIDISHIDALLILDKIKKLGI
jgi:hypothetical protein